jgi:hypothetical protein
MTVADRIDLLDLDLFERGEALRVLRHQSPVHWNPGSDEFKGFWSLTR